MKKINRILFTLFSLCFCGLVLSNANENASLYNTKPSCVFNDLVFDLDFEMARINHCQQTGKNQFSLSIAPEHKPINKSPWYAFKLISEKKRNIEVFLHYSHHQHRYPPKVSTDGENWSLLSDKQYKIILDGKAIKLKLTASKQPLYIAAQPIINNKDYINWLNNFKDVDRTTISELGKSKHNRTIKQLVSTASSNDWILIVGRQHPPELTGAIALLPFVETIMASTELAKQFRNRYNLLIIPNLNPDGVAQGNWRYNMNNVDLNRDWGIYKQPEIALVGNELQRLFDNGDQNLIAGFDFHSTNKDVFYTQPDEPRLNMPFFTRDWLQLIQQTVPDFKIVREATHNPGLPTFKTYMSEHYNIPAITYEMGDDTDVKTIKRVGKVAAESMMKILLER